MNGRETFSTTEHRNLSYLAADTLGSTGNNIGFRRRGGWFITKTYALLLFLLVLVLMVLAVLLGRCSVNRYDVMQSGVISVPESGETQSENNTTSPESDIKKTETTAKLYNSSLHYVIEPIHYNIYLEPPEETSDGNEHFVYSGNVTIILYSKQPVANLTLHAKELSIASSGITLRKQAVQSEEPNNKKGDNSESGNENVLINTYDTNNGILDLSFDQALEIHTPYELIIKFSAALHNLPYGMFRFKYTKSNGIKYGIATNLDYPFARTIFPCLENYGQKATFELHIARKSGGNVVTVSNTIVNKSEIIDNVRWDHFDTTPKIPLQRLALVMADMRQQTKSTNKIERFTIWSRDATDEHSISYALNSGVKLIAYYTDHYFKNHIPIQEIDMFALPLLLTRRKEYGRVVIIRESEIAVDEDITEEKKQLVALNLAGIIAYQWIGTKITFEEEADSWISNAMLNLAGHEGVNAIEPAWNTSDNFQTLMQEATYRFSFYFPIYESSITKNSIYTTNVEDLLEDAYQLSLPKNRQMKTNDQSKKKDDNLKKISQQKGSYLFIMLQNTFTKSLFQSALQQFLKYASSQDVVSASGLWNILSEEIGKQPFVGRKLLPDNLTLEKIIDSWLYQPGIPLVNVTVNYDNNSITFSQTPLLVDTETTSDSEWVIPISYTTKNTKNFTDTVPKLWLTNKDHFNVTINRKFDNQTWILVNPLQVGLYRVHYDENNWKLLQNALHANELPASVVSQLLDDALHLSYANILPYEFSLNMTKVIVSQNITEVIISDTILRHFQDIVQLIETTSAYKTVQSYLYIMLHPIYERLQAISEKSHAEVVLFSKMYRALCLLDSPICLQHSQSIFKDWMAESDPDKNNPIETNIKYAVVCGMLRHGNQSDFDFILARYKKMPFSNDDKIELLRSLVCFNSTSTISKLMNIFSDYNLPLELHHVRIMWQTIGTLPLLKEEALSYIIDNWTGIYNKYSIYPALLTDIIIGAMKNVNEQEALKKISTFKENNEDTLSKLLTLITHMEKIISANIQWRNNNEAEIVNWIKAALQSSTMPRNKETISTKSSNSMAQEIQKSVDRNNTLKTKRNNASQILTNNGKINAFQTKVVH